MLLYAQDYDGYLFPRSWNSDPGFANSRGSGVNVGESWLVTHIWGRRYLTGGLFSCPSRPVSAANMAVMEDWDNQTYNGGFFYVSYCYWNANQTPASSHYPTIYADGDASNGEYPITLRQRYPTTICIGSDAFSAEGGVPRYDMANHKGLDKYGKGGNQLYLDGHAKWKTVDDMVCLGSWMW